jgi:hypothetical protein
MGLISIDLGIILL